jgi:hypothetical protein
MVTKEAMDSAIATAIAERDQQNRQALEAREFVRPIVGNVSLALDTAEDILRTALQMRGVSVKDFPANTPASAYRAILQNLPNGRESTRSYAMDSTAARSFSERFPEANRHAAP